MIDIFFFKISLAWRNLLYSRQRFIVAIFTVSFSVILMLTQIGFRNGMLESNIAFLNQLDADLIVVNIQRRITTLERTFKKNRLYLVRELPEVISAEPLYLTLGTWKNIETKIERVIRVFAFNPEHSAFLLPAITAKLSALKQADSVLADLRSRPVYGPMTSGTVTELSGYQISVVGNFYLGADFIADGNLIMSDLNFLTIFSSRPSGFAGDFRTSLDNVDLGLIKVKPQTNLESLMLSLKAHLPQDIKVFTKQSYINREIDFYSKATLGFIFTLGAIIGFVIGTLVVYNIIVSDIKHNMIQYGTLRAIGHSSNYLLTIILLQATLIAILGFIPGLSISLLLCYFLSEMTGLLIPVQQPVIIVIFVSTMVMCLLAGTVASQRLKLIDPADIYSHKS